MNIISKKSTVMSLVLAGLVVGGMPTIAQAAWADLTPSQKALMSLGLVSFMLTSMKESVNEPEAVTSKDVKNLVQIQDIFTQDYWANVYHIISDGYIGQLGKGKAIQGVTDEDTGEVKFRASKSQPSTGICGTAIATTKLVAKKVDDLVKTLALPVVAYMWYNNEKVTIAVGGDGIKCSVKVADEAKQ